MKILILLCVFMVLNNTAFSQINSDDISGYIEMVRAKHAPDKRTAIFNIDYYLQNDIAVLSGETNLPAAKTELLEHLNKFKVKEHINLLPEKELGEKVYGVVNLSVADVRVVPENTAELATQVLLGSTLKILKSARGWYLVQCEDDYIGWIDNDGIELMNKTELENWQKSEKVIITSPFTFVYSELSENSIPVSDIVEGDLLQKITIDKNFIRVMLPDGREGFVNSSDAENYSTWINSRKQTFENIKLTAERLMGIPYVWGGTSIKGLDCSGFTKTVFRLNGILLPRDASQQVFVGEEVDTQNGFDNLQPGDLLFFGVKQTAAHKEKITHVAIYLGNLEFIHASGRVRINSFDKSKSNFAESRYKTFVKAKRILTSLGKNGVKVISLSNNK